MERKFSILGLLVIIPYMEFCFLKVGKIDMFSKTLAGKLKYPFNFLNKFNMIKCDQFSKATVILFKVNLKCLYLSFHLIHAQFVKHEELRKGTPTYYLIHAQVTKCIHIYIIICD